MDFISLIKSYIMHHFQRKDPINYSADHRDGDKHCRPAQATSGKMLRPEILEIADRMIKKHQADLEYLKER